MKDYYRGGKRCLRESKEKQRAWANKRYEKLKEETTEKGITPSYEEEIVKTLQKKSYDKSRNEKREIKENKFICRNLIGTKEKQRTYATKCYEKVQEEREEKGSIPPNEEEIVKTLQKKTYDKSSNKKRDIKENKYIHRNFIMSKERKRTYKKISYEKVKEERE